MSFQILNNTKNSVLASHAEVARTPQQRLIGVSLMTEMPQGYGLIFEKCNSIHTFGLLFSIDVIWLNPQSERVIECRTISPQSVWHLKQYPVSMCWVIELPEGTLSLTGTAPGDELNILASPGAGLSMLG